MLWRTELAGCAQRDSAEPVKQSGVREGQRCRRSPLSLSLPQPWFRGRSMGSKLPSPSHMSGLQHGASRPHWIGTRAAAAVSGLLREKPELRASIIIINQVKTTHLWALYMPLPDENSTDTASTRKTLYRKYLLFLPTSIPQTENSTDCTVHIHTTKSSSAFLAWCGTRSLLRPLHERPQKRKPWAQPTKRPLARRNQRERRATHQASKHKNTAATVTHRNNPITEDTAETYSSIN